MLNEPLHSEIHDIVDGYQCPKCGGKVRGATDEHEAESSIRRGLGVWDRKLIHCRSCGKWYVIEREIPF